MADQPVPAFFQVLVGDFSEKLKVPSAFVNHLNGPSLCKLQVRNGRCWDVKLEEENNDLFFHKGWTKFVKENFLDERDFLLFSYDGNLLFSVTIYDESACEMDMEAAKTKRTGSDQRRDYVPPRELRIVEFNSENFCFKRTMKKHRMYKLNIPKVISKAKLQMRKQIIVLQDPSKNLWPVEVSLMPDGRLSMYKGWRGCCKRNEIKEGQTIVLEFVNGHVNLHIFRADGCIVILAGPNVVN